ncbi:MAG: T9SS type A sorting domain-containing protein [Bacteroidia bacterium]|jgi:hypothetical protein|nr:T9SS type A sorting domain-containing protein [Bacteroidia bacterium]
MKKLLLSISLLTAFTAFSQDISITLNTPANGATILQGQSFNVSYTVKNVGTRALTSADSILVGFTLGNSILQSGGSPIIQLINTNIPIGDSVNGALNGLSLTFQQAGNTSICAIALLDGDTVNDDDNADCASITLSFNAGLSDQERIASTIKAFPNPAETQITFSAELTNGFVTVYDLTGRLLNTISLNQEAVLDLSTFDNGIYIYTITNEKNELIKTAKFTVSK